MENNFLKNFWLWLAAIVIGGGVFFFLKFPVAGPSAGSYLSGIEARLNVISDSVKIRAFKGPVADGMSILEVLYSASKGDGLDLRYAADKNGSITLLSLNNIPDAGNKKWHFYLNGKPVKTSDINKTIVRRGDLIEVKLE